MKLSQYLHSRAVSFIIKTVWQSNVAKTRRRYLMKRRKKRVLSKEVDPGSDEENMSNVAKISLDFKKQKELNK